MGDHGEVVDRAIESLRELPEVSGDATARVLIAVAAVRQRERDAAHRRARNRRRWLSWGGIAAAATVVGVVSQLPIASRRGTTASPAEGTASQSPVVALPVSRNVDVASSLRSVQLVLDAPSARSVRVVGDFNGWDERQSPMVRDEGSGLWSVNLMLRPGRHVYAFVVNDTQWVRDPRAAAAPDADFGRAGSVLLVGRP